jgi:hypothetical protein
MAGIYTAQMVAMRFGVSDHRARQALVDLGLPLGLDDQVDADLIEKNQDKIKKWLDDQWADYMADKEATAGAGDEKAKWLEKHNASIPQVSSPEEWAAAATAGLSGKSTSKSEE